MIDTLVFLVELAMPIGFVVVAAMFAKRIGGAGPWLLGVVGAVDAALMLAFRAVFWVMRDSHRASFEIERILDTVRLLDCAAMYACGFVALLACLLMMPKTPR